MKNFLSAFYGFPPTPYFLEEVQQTQPFVLDLRPEKQLK